MLLKARTEEVTMCWDSGCSEPFCRALPGRGRRGAETNMWEDIYHHWVDVCVHVSTHSESDHRLPEDYIPLSQHLIPKILGHTIGFQYVYMK